jgi:hypothetical protein
MSQFRLVPADMSDAAARTSDAAADARGHDSADHLATAGGAVPGAQSVGYLAELGDGWREEVEGWADDVAAFASHLEAVSRTAVAVDGLIGDAFAGLTGLLGAGR